MMNMYSMLRLQPPSASSLARSAFHVTAGAAGAASPRSVRMDVNRLFHKASSLRGAVDAPGFGFGGLGTIGELGAFGDTTLFGDFKVQGNDTYGILLGGEPAVIDKINRDGANWYPMSDAVLSAADGVWSQAVASTSQRDQAFVAQVRPQLLAAIKMAEEAAANHNMFGYDPAAGRRVGTTMNRLKQLIVAVSAYQPSPPDVSGGLNLNLPPNVQQQATNPVTPGALTPGYTPPQQYTGGLPRLGTGTGTSALTATGAEGLSKYLLPGVVGVAAIGAVILLLKKKK